MLFKKYDQDQQFLLPLSLADFVPVGHIARTLSDLLDGVDISEIEATYSEEGQPTYHPRMLLKILFYGYMTGVRSSRKIEERTHTDIVFMWLCLVIPFLV